MSIEASSRIPEMPRARLELNGLQRTGRHVPRDAQHPKPDPSYSRRHPRVMLYHVLPATFKVDNDLI